MIAAHHSAMIPEPDPVLLYTFATNSDSWDGFVASADATYTGDGGTIRANMAFREGIPTQNYNDAWSTTSTTNHWIQIKLDFAKKAVVFGLCPRRGFWNNCPKIAHLLGSNDGVSFTNLLDISISQQPTSSDEIFFEIPNRAKWLYYRLFIDQCFGDRISVGRFRLYGK